MSTQPPERQASVKPFDPLILDRTVIALPLMQKMREDLARIERLKELVPDAVSQFNAAIEYNPDYPEGGADRAREKAVSMASAAAVKASASAESRVSTGPEDVRKRNQARAADLQKAIADQTIGPLLDDTNIGLARMHAAVLRRLET